LLRQGCERLDDVDLASDAPVSAYVRIIIFEAQMTGPIVPGRCVFVPVPCDERLHAHVDRAHVDVGAHLSDSRSQILSEILGAVAEPALARSVRRPGLGSRRSLFKAGHHHPDALLRDQRLDLQSVPNQAHGSFSGNGLWKTDPSVAPASCGKSAIRWAKSCRAVRLRPAEHRNRRGAM